VECNSTADDAFKCVITPVASWPLLDPPQTCQVANGDKACQPGYKCETEAPGEPTGTCVPSKTVNCDDGDSCTKGDVCAGGLCKPAETVNCDDGDACTLDSCANGVCSHKKLAKCSACIEEGFDVSFQPGVKPTLPKGWITDSDDLEYITWAPDPAAPHGGSKFAARAKWKGPAKGAAKQPTRYARMLHRRLYLRAGSGHQLQFHLAMKVANQTCDNDTLAIYVNNLFVWQKCDDSTPASKSDPYQKMTIDLSKYAGAHADIEFRIVAGAGKTSTGTIDVDSVKMVGDCTEGCLGVDFEERRAYKLDKMDEIPRRPQTWTVSSDAPATLSWQLSKKGGHTGKAAYAATWSAPPPGGKAGSATLRMKTITPGKDSTLHLAWRAPEVGISGCAADSLKVVVAGKEVAKLCDQQSAWKVIDIDVSAWVGKAVNIDLVATTGTAPGSKARFEVDDIAIDGPCTYLCYRETFDDNGIDWWEIQTSNVNVVTWKLVSNTFYSKPNAVWSGFEAQPEGGDGAVVVAKETKGHRFMVPVAGATYRYAARLSYPDYCPKDPKDVHPSPVLLALRRYVTPDGGIADDEGGELSFRVGKHCKGNDAWTVYTGEVVGKSIDAVKTGPRGLTVVPEIGMLVLEGGVKMNVWFDEISFTCR